MDGQTVDGEARRSVVSTEAAGLRLGIKADSIRARLRRGSLEGYQDAAGVWWIFADQLQGGRARRGPARPGRVAQDATHDSSALRVAVLEAQLAAVTDERDNLRLLAQRQAEAVGEAAGRIAELAERVARLQLQAPPTAVQATEGTENTASSSTTPLQEAGAGLAATVLGEEVRGLRVALERQRRPWWRRVMGK